MVYPGAYEPGPDASIVVAVFASDGSVLTHAVKRLPLADVFDTPLGAKGDRISARGAEYLLGLVLPAELGHDDEIGSTVMRNAPHVVLVSAVRHQE